MCGKKEYGDYQTPFDFALAICTFLRNKKNIEPDVILEPTCGIGNFLKSSLIFKASKYYGIEINPEYCQTCIDTITDACVEIVNADFFKFDLSKFRQENVLIIGNPPWVNSSSLSRLCSTNLPKKSNFKGLKGIEALTGASNFDICEYILLQLLDTFSGSNATIAMLCKTSVARNIFKELKRQRISFEYCDIIEFNAKKIFNINTAACLLLIKLTSHYNSPDYCDIYSFEDTTKIKSSITLKNGQFLNKSISKIDDFDGTCCFEWRQGIKHDCSAIMELTQKDGKLINGKNDLVQIECELIFPLVKSSMFKKPIIDFFSKYVIVTQKNVREDTTYIKLNFPLTWKYLNCNKGLFDRRKSSIYRDSPPFSIFGIGSYSYSQYKVGVSGFYKDPFFSVLLSPDGKPVMTDDTSYFITFSTYDAAYTAMLYLNSSPVQSFLKNIAFLDAKRPYTKKVLSRLDFSKIIRQVNLTELKLTESRLGIHPYITKNIVNHFHVSCSL